MSSKTKSRTRKPRIMQTVKTTRFILGSPSVPSGTAATVTATGSGRFQIELIGVPGLRYWVDADAIVPT